MDRLWRDNADAITAAWHRLNERIEAAAAAQSTARAAQASTAPSEAAAPAAAATA